MSASFIPPYFSKFGKSVQDLLKKKFDADNSVKYVRKSNGTTLEQGVTVGDVSKGFLKLKCSDKVKKADYDLELNSDVKTNSKASVKFASLPVAGAVATLEVNSKDKDKTFNGAVGKLDLEYSQEYVALNVAIKSDTVANKVDANASAGFDGFSVGGGVVLNATQAVEVADVNFGAEWARHDWSVSAYSEKNAELLNLAVFHKYSPSLQLAALSKVGLRSGDVDVTVAADYALDKRTQLKVKSEFPASVYSVALEQKLSNPAVSFNVAATFSQKNVLAGSVRADKLGFGATFGDY